MESPFNKPTFGKTEQKKDDNIVWGNKESTGISATTGVVIPQGNEKEFTGEEAAAPVLENRSGERDPNVSGSPKDEFQPRGFVDSDMPKKDEFPKETFQNPHAGEEHPNVNADNRSTGPVQQTGRPTSLNAERQRIIDEHGGQISNIPINHRYWTLREEDRP